jgi:prepilin-type processing-associated H-X9-DG protein
MKKNFESGFTRLELLAIIAVLAIGALVALPSLASIARDSNSALCQSNQRQLMRALHLYCADNSDYLPYNRDQTVGQWLTHSATSTPDATNTAKLFDPQYDMIANYLDPAINVFKCPADPSVVTNGTALVPKVRSISMNQAVGTKDNVLGGRAPVDGPWLDGFHNHHANTVWRCYGRLADVVNPVPSALFVLLDENPDSINDAGCAAVGPQLPAQSSNLRWLDWPATYHDNGSSFAFADGHSETHLWTDPPGTMTPKSAPGTNDLVWFSRHTSGFIADQP